MKNRIKLKSALLATALISSAAAHAARVEREIQLDHVGKVELAEIGTSSVGLRVEYPGWRFSNICGIQLNNPKNSPVLMEALLEKLSLQNARHEEEIDPILGKHQAILRLRESTYTDTINVAVKSGETLAELLKGFNTSLVATPFKCE